jgi:serine/threonine protein kinase
LSGYRDRYDVVREIGKGGMGTVFLARPKDGGPEVAVKALHSRYAQNEDLVRRFRREAHLVQKLDHPNVVKLVDHDLTASEPYLVFEHVDGAVTLAQFLFTAGPTDPGLRLRIGLDVASGLAHIHERGIIHRDLKPGNVLLDANQRARIIDLGLSRSVTPDHSLFTGASDHLGTWAYMAPEQLDNEPVSLRTDVYALGLILHELALGSLAFSTAARRPVTVQERLSRGVPLLPEDVPDAIRRLVARCVEYAPADRPATAAQVRDALARALGLAPSIRPAWIALALAAGAALAWLALRAP